MDDGSNGRVRDARLEERMVALQHRVEEIYQHVKYLSGHQAQVGNDLLSRQIQVETMLAKTVETVDRLVVVVGDLEKYRAASDERWSAHKDEHAREAKTQYTFATVLSTVTSAISGIVATLAGKP